jgi:GntR family transcriptional regulator/MocR family aminotransferase
LPGPAWPAAWRAAAQSAPPDRLDPLGQPELRAVLVDHIGQTVGPVPAGHTVVVTGGAAHAVRLVLAALALPAGAVALEDPTRPGLRSAVGPGEPFGLPGDEDGALVDAVPAGCRAMVLTPDAHLPLARPMSAGRRRAAADWAHRAGGHLIAVQPTRPPDPGAVPLPALLGLGPAARTTLVGEVCDPLAPVLRLGYAVVPAVLAPRIGQLLLDEDATAPYVTQLAAARLLRDGTMRRLVRDLHDVNERKRRAVAAVLAPLGEEFRLGPGTVTGAAPLRLPSGVDAERVAAAARRRGVGVRTLASYYWSGRATGPGLVLGYGHLRMDQLRRGLSTLVHVLAA